MSHGTPSRCNLELSYDMALLYASIAPRTDGRQPPPPPAFPHGYDATGAATAHTSYTRYCTPIIGTTDTRRGVNELYKLPTPSSRNILVKQLTMPSYLNLDATDWVTRRVFTVSIGIMMVTDPAAAIHLFQQQYTKWNFLVKRSCFPGLGCSATTTLLPRTNTPRELLNVFAQSSFDFEFGPERNYQIHQRKNQARFDLSRTSGSTQILPKNAGEPQGSNLTYHLDAHDQH